MPPKGKAKMHLGWVPLSWVFLAQSVTSLHRLMTDGILPSVWFTCRGKCPNVIASGRLSRNLKRDEE